MLMNMKEKTAEHKGYDEKDILIQMLSEQLNLVSMQLSEKKKEIESLKLENLELRLSLAARFRRTSEKFSADQLDLFNEVEFEAKNNELNEPEEETEDSDKESTPAPAGKNEKKPSVRKGKKHKSYSKLNVPADTPVVTIPDSSNPPVCSVCGMQMVKVGETYTDSIARTEIVTVIRRMQNIYACVNCGEGTRQTVHSDNILENSVADPLLLADILNSKFNMGVPLYRQERLFAEQGLGISRQLMSSIIMRVGGRIMDNLEPMLEEELFRMPLINADETGLKVITLLDENGERKAPDSKFNSFIIGRIGVDEKGSPGLASFIFRDNRRNLTISDLFDGYHGCVQSDGLSGYAFSEKKDEFTHLGCLVHCRRKAVEAMGNRKAGIAFDMVSRYAKIFHTESIWNKRRNTMSGDEFIAGRKAAMLPLFEDMKDWLETLVATANAKGHTINDRLNTAIKYFLERYDELVRFLDYPFATSGNQLAEQSIRKWVIDRNNMLFCFTETGADVSAFFFSLIVSCRNLGINPTDYLAHLFLNCNNLKNGDREGWRALLPGRCDLSDVAEHRRLIAHAAPIPGNTEPFVLRGKNW